MSKMKKPKTLRSNPPPMAANTNRNETRDNDADVQFEVELCWCVQQLQNALFEGKMSQKLTEDTLKNIKILKSATQPLIKKRQVMKASMGDYRLKMKEEEKKLGLATKQIKFTPSTEFAVKSNFVKKSAILTSGADFKFNFTTNLTDTKDQEIAQNGNNTNTNLNKSNQLNFNNTGGSDFKFNFVLNEINDEIKFEELSIKN